MAKVYDIDAYRAAGPSQEVPVTRNQQILAEIHAMMAARTPEQILTAKIKGTEEELQEVQRRYARLLEDRERLLTPSEIAADDLGGPEPPSPERGGRER